MKTFNDFLNCIFVAIGVLGVIVFIFGPPKVTITPDQTPTVIFDSVTEEQIIRVEETCRRYIALWEADLELYNETKDSDNPDIQRIHERVKTRMNEVADSYNKYLMTNGYVFAETLPEGIYAYIGRTEETDE